MNIKRGLTTLKAARNLIKNPENWTQGTYHAINNGIECYCLKGALYKASETDDEPLGLLYAADVLEQVIVESGVPEQFSMIIKYNDNHTHAEVISMLDKAIVRREETK